MNIITEFRIYPVSGGEPEDRTTAGTALGSGGVLDLGTADTTDGTADSPVRVICWRVRDMNGAGEVRNIRVWLEGANESGGAEEWSMDITDVWTKGKTPVQVAMGSPGAAPLAKGAPNLERIGGGTITGTSHDQTARYIYLAGRFGPDVPAGALAGPRLVVTYDVR